MDQSLKSVPVHVREVFITEELHRRPPLDRDYAREKLAFQDISSLIVSSPEEVLPRLVDLSLDLCHAVTGGISIYEEADHVFRWHHLRGTLEKFTGSTTPRNNSPCGVTIDGKSPMLVQKPERVYSWLVEAGVSLPECLLVPLSIGNDEPIGTVWIVSEETGHFREAHARTLTDIASFVGIALHVIRSENRLKSALDEQELLTREMAHRVTNLFAIVQGMVPVAARRSSTVDEMAGRLSARLTALSKANAVVHPALDKDHELRQTADLGELVAAVLQPYDHAAITLRGQTLALGQRGANAVALILYELATNASKYGALSTETGKVSVVWKMAGGQLTIKWSETEGPRLAVAPEKAGFGTSLVSRTVSYYKGTTAYDWRETGLELTITLPETSIVA